MTITNDARWYEDDTKNEASPMIDGFDITAVPSDFNVMTLKQLVETGWVRIPGFQRNFVWGLGRASKLIESLILGLPVPQLFLYQQEPGRNLLIDGQQRLMSIYYFAKGRFPREDKHSKFRRKFDDIAKISKEVLHDDKYFKDFRLQLRENLPGQKNKLSNLDYLTLGDQHRASFNLRPVRCIIIKQNKPSDGDATMYEIFNRLNSGGMNLRPQEIRSSMYHSPFYNMLGEINEEKRWRRDILQSPVPDLHMKDIEILLRGFAMLVDSDKYKPSMVKFLNIFSKKCQANDAKDNKRLKGVFKSFLGAASGLPKGVFINKNNRFNIALFEAVFTATCKRAYEKRGDIEHPLDAGRIKRLKGNKEFIAAAQKGTTQTRNVETRLRIAFEILVH